MKKVFDCAAAPAEDAFFTTGFRLPDAAENGWSKDLMVRMVHSAFAGTVTADTSISPSAENAFRPVQKVYSWARKPTESPLTSPVLMAAHASSSPGSQLRRHIRYGLHQHCRDFQPFPARRTVHWPTGGNGHAARETGSYCQLRPLGSRMSPSRSGEGVDAIR